MAVRRKRAVVAADQLSGQRDVFSWLDGALVLGYILGMGVLMGCALSAAVGLASRLLGPWQRQRFYHLVPGADSAGRLRRVSRPVGADRQFAQEEGVPVFWASDLRLALLIGASLWSLWLAVGITRQYPASAAQRLAALGVFGLALALVDANWVLMFWGW